MRRIMHIIALCAALLLSSCDVHELPEMDRDEKVPFLLHLDFSTQMPLYKEVLYTKSGGIETKVTTQAHDIRYIINAYRQDKVREENRTPDATFVYTKADDTDLNYIARLELPEGNYDFKVWADYVDVGSTEDKYYDTRDFSEIILSDKDNHPGSNDCRDVFRGYASATVYDPTRYTGSMQETIDNQSTVQMMRPVGKFKFVSTDLDVFLVHVIQMMYGKTSDIPLDSKAAYEQLLQDINLGEFYVVFKYNAFMPCSYNMFTDKPADSWTGMTFKSHMHAVNNNEITLGFDYIFVNGSETTLSVSLQVYNKDGVLMSSSNPINVPVVRSKLTVVKGEFLSSTATGGVTINPGYDGDDYNIEIY